MEKENFSEYKKIESESELETKIFRDLNFLSGMESLPGKEELVREFLIKEAEKLNIESEVDQIGNLYFKSDKKEGSLMLCAHMDKIGEAKKAVLSGGDVCGRLDDALGISMILNALKKGFRPSVLFTVQEEPGGYGSRYAGERIYRQEVLKPQMILVLDVSALLKQGDGPIVYTESGGVRFPSKVIDLLKEIFADQNQRANFIRGFPNDSAVLGRLPNQNIATLQVHVDNMHTQMEIAKISDIEEAMNALEIIIKNSGRFHGSQDEIPTGV